MQRKIFHMRSRIVFKAVTPCKMNYAVGIPHFNIRINHIEQARLNARGTIRNSVNRPINRHDIVAASRQLFHNPNTEKAISSRNRYLHRILRTGNLTTHSHRKQSLSTNLNRRMLFGILQRRKRRVASIFIR